MSGYDFTMIECLDLTGLSRQPIDFVVLGVDGAGYVGYGNTEAGVKSRPQVHLKPMIALFAT